MGLKDYLKRNQVDGTLKPIEVEGEQLFIRQLSVFEADQYHKLDDDEKGYYLLQSALVNEDGTPALSGDDMELVKSAKNIAIQPIVSEIINYSFGLDLDPKN